MEHDLYGGQKKICYTLKTLPKTYNKKWIKPREYLDIWVTSSTADSKVHIYKNSGKTYTNVRSRNSSRHEKNEQHDEGNRDENIKMLHVIYKTIMERPRWQNDGGSMDDGR